jgi:hypothetical protein
MANEDGKRCTDDQDVAMEEECMQSFERFQTIDPNGVKARILVRSSLKQRHFQRLSVGASQWEVGIEWNIAELDVQSTDTLPSENIAFLTPESSLNIFTGPIPKLALSK